MSFKNIQCYLCTFNNTLMLFIKEFCYLVKPLMWIFFVEIGSIQKFSFDIIGLTDTLLMYLLIKTYLIGVSTSLRYDSKYVNILNCLNKFIFYSLKEASGVNNKEVKFERLKPFLNYCGFFFIENNILLDLSLFYDNLKLRKECNFFSELRAYSLVNWFVLPTRNCRFSTKVDGDSDLQRSIVENLKVGIWPMQDLKLNLKIMSFITTIQNFIVNCKPEQQLIRMKPFLFHLVNRVYSIEYVFKSGKNSAFAQVGYSDLILEEHKFQLLEDTKFSRLLNLPPCKSVIVEGFKVTGSKGSFGISMPVDKVLQRMVLNFLDVHIEDKLKSNIFGYRKGRDARHVVAGLYSKLRYIRYINNIHLSSFYVENCFENLSHKIILAYYPFPIFIQFLLERWLKPKQIFRNKDYWQNKFFGILQVSLLEFSINNYFLSFVLPANVFYKKLVKGKSSFFWLQTFVYFNNIVMVSNHSKIFYSFFQVFLENLNKISLRINVVKTKFFIKFHKSFRFVILGFEFIIMVCRKLKSSPLYRRREFLDALRQKDTVFVIILKPENQKIFEIKKKIDQFLSCFLHVTKTKLYLIFRRLNSVVFSWHSFFYFNQGCIYGARLDQYLLVKMKKFLIHKFRYHGKFRSKWIAYNFGGLGRKNPNGRSWQFQTWMLISKEKNFQNINNIQYIWKAEEVFKIRCITSFFFNKKFWSKNYYRYRKEFEFNKKRILKQRLWKCFNFLKYKEQFSFS